MERLDGNALAGALAELLGRDLTAAVARCTGCGMRAALATAEVYLSAMGAVVRCRGCGGVEAVIVTADGRRCVSLSGVSGVEIPSA